MKLPNNTLLTSGIESFLKSEIALAEKENRIAAPNAIRHYVNSIKIENGKMMKTEKDTIFLAESHVLTDIDNNELSEVKATSMAEAEELFKNKGFSGEYIISASYGAEMVGINVGAITNKKGVKV